MALGEDWELLPNGNAKVFPLHGFQTASVPPIGLVRVEWFEDEQAFDDRQVTAVQLNMTASQARDLSAALLRLAESLEIPARGRMQ